MAEEYSEGGSVMDDLYWFLGILAVLIVLWYFAGGPGKADLRGIFLAPPEPVGTGEAYGPTYGEGSTEATSTPYDYTLPPIESY